MSQIINGEMIAEAKSIMKDKFPMMVEYFLEDTVMYMKVIDDGLATNDLEKIKSPAHTIKSSAHQLGAEKMSVIAKQIESMAKDIKDDSTGDFDNLKMLFEELEAAFAETEPELKKLANCL